MGDWTSYAVADFVPFTAEVYFRLIARVSERLWPLHAVTLGAGLAAAGLAWSGRTRIAGMLLAAILAWVGVAFLAGEYAQLNWAGTWFGGAFVAAAALLLLFTAPGPRGSARPRARLRTRSVPELAGLLLAAFGLLVYPLIAPLAGNGWSRAETFGIHPDPTAVAALGIVLMMLRGFRLWPVGIVLLSWCLASALTLQVLDAPWAYLLHAAAGVALLAMLWTSVAGGRSRPTKSSSP